MTIVFFSEGARCVKGRTALKKTFARCPAKFTAPRFPRNPAGKLDKYTIHVQVLGTLCYHLLSEMRRRSLCAGGSVIVLRWPIYLRYLYLCQSRQWPCKPRDPLNTSTVAHNPRKDISIFFLLLTKAKLKWWHSWFTIARTHLYLAMRKWRNGERVQFLFLPRCTNVKSLVKIKEWIPHNIMSPKQRPGSDARTHAWTYGRTK